MINSTTGSIALTIAQSSNRTVNLGADGNGNGIFGINNYPTNTNLEVNAVGKSGGDLFAPDKNGTTGDVMVVTRGGNVGIGTATPGYPLDVNGVINANGGSAYYPLRLTSTAGSAHTGILVNNKQPTVPSTKPSTTVVAIGSTSG